MAEKKEKVYVQFKEHKPTKLPNGKMSKPPERVEFGNGEFRGTFVASEQPFAVTKEEAEILKNSGLFEDAEAPAEKVEAEKKSEPEGDVEKAAAASAPSRNAKKEKASDKTKDAN